MKQYHFLLSILGLMLLPSYSYPHDLPDPTQTTQQLNFFRRTLAQCIRFYEQYKKYRTNQFSPEEKEQFEAEIKSLRNKLLFAGSMLIIVPTVVLYVHYISKKSSAASNQQEIGTAEKIKKKLHELEQRTIKIERTQSNKQMQQDKQTTMQQYQQQLRYLHEQKMAIFQAITKKYQQQRSEINIQHDDFDKLEQLEAAYAQELINLDATTQEEYQKLITDYQLKLSHLNKTSLINSIASQ